MYIYINVYQWRGQGLFIMLPTQLKMYQQHCVRAREKLQLSNEPKCLNVTSSDFFLTNTLAETRKDK